MEFTYKSAYKIEPVGERRALPDRRRMAKASGGPQADDEVIDITAGKDQGCDPAATGSHQGV